MLLALVVAFAVAFVVALVVAFAVAFVAAFVVILSAAKDLTQGGAARSAEPQTDHGGQRSARRHLA